MPGKPLVRIGVSSELPHAVVFGADTFIGENFVSELLGNQLKVIAVGEKKGGLVENKELKVISLSSWSETKVKKVDYVVALAHFSLAVQLAKRRKARLLTVVDVESPGEEIAVGDRLEDWRMVKTGFIYGPTTDFSSPTFLNKIILEAVLDLPVRIPFSEKGKVRPLYIADFCQVLSQVLFPSGLGGKEIHLYGRSVSLARFLSLVEKAAGNTQGVRVDPDLSLPQTDGKKKNPLFPASIWETELAIGVTKTVQFFFQKVEKGELDRQMLAAAKPSVKLPSVGSKPVEKEKKTKKSEKPVIDDQFWAAPAKKSESVLPETKTEKEKPEKVIIEDSLPEEESIEEERAVLPAEEKKVKQKSEPERKEEQKLSLGKGWWLGGAALAIFIAVGFIFGPLVGAVFNLGLGALELRKSVDLLKTQRFVEAETVARKAETKFGRAAGLATTRSPAVVYKLSQTGKRASHSIWLMTQVGYRGQRVIQAVLRDEEIDLLQGKKELRLGLERLVWQLGLLEGEFSGPWPGLPGVWRGKPLAYREQISRARKGVEKALPLIDSLDWLLGEKERRTYLVLLQNNMELRPTGGFIGSFALFNFADGRLLDFSVKDVYVADGQLKGHVDSPEPIREILGEESWYLRDSNWNPHFPASAKNAAWFLEKEIGINPDGVIAFNLTAAQKIVSNLGEIYLPDYNETINVGNLFERAEFYSETNFFPGSTQKASFLSALGEQLFETIKTASPAEYSSIATAVFDSLEEKEIMVTTDNETLNQSLKDNNWNGEVKTLSSAKDNSFADYLFLVEANLGVNKVNYFLRRAIEQAVNIGEEGRIDHVLKINYENTSQSANWPGGDYKNYLRLYLPRSTKVSQVFIYDPLAVSEENRIPLAQDQIDQTVESGKALISLLAKVPVASRRTVEVHFSQKTEINQDNWSYLYYWQKQSGFGSTPVTLLISYPSGWQPVQVNPEATLSENGLIFNQQLEKDIPFGVEFGR